MKVPFIKKVKVQMKKVNDGGKVLWSNPEQIDIKMEQSGYIEFELYDGENLICTHKQFLGANCTFGSPGIYLTETKDLR